MSEQKQEQGQKQAVRAATAWHPPFYDLIMERAPPTTEVRVEVVLSQQPRRADLVLLRRKGAPPRDGEARVLRGLWPRLGPVALAELKGPTSGFRSTDLLRLLGYGMQYHELNMQALGGPAALTLALLTPAETPSLRAAIDHMGWRLERLDNGYARIAGAWYSTLVAFIDEVCEAERDDYLRLFSRHRKQNQQATWWLNLHRLRMTTMENAHELEGYDDLVERVLSTLSPEEVLRHYKPEEVLQHYKPEEVLRHYKPEERLAGLAPEEVLRHYKPEEVLRHFESSLRSRAEGELPPELVEMLRKYLSRTR